MTREEIEQLDDTEPYSFETDREEWWYKIGLKEGLETADQNPRKGLWDSEKVCKFIKDNVREYHKSGVFHIDDFINDLRKSIKEE